MNVTGKTVTGKTVTGKTVTGKTVTGKTGADPDGHPVAAAEADDIFLTVLDAFTANIAVVDGNGIILAVNRAWRDFAAANGAPELAAHSVGVDYRDACALPASAGGGFFPGWVGIAEVLSGARACFTLEYPCNSPDEVRWFVMNAHRLPPPQCGVVVVHENITARKAAEDALRLAHAEAERASWAKSRFLAAASHDLRQPLSALRLYVDVLEHKLPAAEQPLYRSMKECVESLGALLTDLLDLSKLDAGVIEPSASDFAVVDLFARIEAAYAPEAKLERISLRFRESGLIAHTDATLYARMLGNLVDNAVRYTERGGVLVGCRQRGGKLWVEVWDTGIGIAAESLDEIFEEFRQLGGRQYTRGSGLGLAIVAKTAALLRLQVRVRSRPGKGSMFALELPPGRMLPTRSAGVTRFRPARIALVENTSLVRNALAYALEAVGHQVVAAVGGRELIERLGTRAPDIVISDYRLGEHESGFDVIKALKARFGAQLPGIIITGDTDPALMRSMADRGIVVQHKPVDLDVLRVCIEELTDSDRRGRPR